MLRIQQLTGRLALGLAAAALTMTTFATPAAAGLEDVDKLARADIQVTARGSQTFGNTTRYTFEIKNLGPADAPVINAYKAARIDGPGNFNDWVDDGYFTLGLTAGESRTVNVSCTAVAPKTCAVAVTHAWVPAVIPVDPNKNNNGATIP